ncbi:slit homolog 1 protein-like isoform X1 [Schistocerca americana]|uniref:slit homolog 1 protein-like isoform X1 n=2 Tax=Schistocerca americana TaxID=7009 RepID=UPI001F4F3814|nr:slit homolog 1 protein-like isoform X1 [Schistocerca americana]
MVNEGTGNTSLPTTDMEAPSTVFAFLLSLAVQWLLVSANLSGAPPTTTTGLAADTTSTIPYGAPQIGESPTAKLDSFTVDLDAPTTNQQAHSGEGVDRDAITERPTAATTDLRPVTTSRGCIARNAAGVSAVQRGSKRLSAHNKNPSTVTTESTTKPETLTARPTKPKPEPICPAGCKCENLEVHCSRAGLVAFPEGLDPRTTYLDVGHNRLTAIADDELAELGLTKLTSLICDDNAIETVGLYAFRGLHDLALLQLSGNRIRKLSPFIFVGNRDLRHIDLTGNPLQLEHGPLLMVQQLEWLDLDQCNITYLALDAFRDMRGLRYLNLSGNRLTWLRLSHFSGLNYLRYIKLNGNPLVCDCSTKSLWRWFKQQAVHVDAKCIAPNNGTTHSWNFLEVLHCVDETEYYPPLP